MSLKRIVRLHKAHRLRRLLSGITPAGLIRPVVDAAAGSRLIVIVGSAHKVGSTWLDAMLEDMLNPRCDFEGILIPRMLRRVGGSVDFSGPEAAQFLAGLRGIWQFKTHHDLPVEVSGLVKVVSVHRDLRDMCVSATHSGTNLPYEFGGYPDEVSSLPLAERLSFELHRDYNLSRAEYWWHYPGDLKITYEDLQGDAAIALDRVAGFLNVSTTAKQRTQVVAEHDFKRRSDRNAGEEEPTSFLRKGIVGDWKNVFNQNHIAEFKAAQDGRWNKLLVEMGYESQLDW